MANHVFTNNNEISYLLLLKLRLLKLNVKKLKISAF